MSILVTGGAGFIGSHFIHYLLETGYENIINIDALTYAGNLQNTERFSNHPQYQFVKGNITDQQLIESIFKSSEIDTIINFAAESHVDRSLENDQPFYKSNVEGVKVLLEVAEKNWQNKEGKKFIQISTDEVYGPRLGIALFTEDCPLNPTNPYAISKMQGERLVMNSSIPFCIIRGCNNYGPYQHPEKLIPKVITQGILGFEIPIYGDGQYEREWIYVEDCVRAIELVIAKGETGEVYNIGSGVTTSNVAIVEILSEKLKKYNVFLNEKFVEDRCIHDRRYGINWRKLLLLGWQPEMTLDKGIRQTVDWYWERSQWWKGILGKKGF